MKSQPPRVALIGLDGADWSLLQPLFDRGLMPALKSFVDGSASATLESVLPTNSMSAWTSLMTGVHPGKHGVFDFVRHTSTPFQTLVTNSSSIRYPTVCELLTRAGLSSCVIDMPPFHPPFAIEGVMLGGVGVLTEETLGHPGEIGALVREKAGGYIDDVPWLQYAGREEEMAERLIALTENRLRVAQVLLDERPFDLFCCVFVTPDRVQHALWRDVLDGGPHRAQAERVFTSLDEAFARLLERIDPRETDVLVVSDHGFRRAGKVVSVNEVLEQAGLTRTPGPPWYERLLMESLLRAPLPAGFRRARAEALMRRTSRMSRSLRPGSRAYSESADCVHVNLAGRETTGTVPNEAYEETRAAAAGVLESFTDPATGVRPIRRVIKREEYFRGPFAEEAPDLVLEFAEGYAYSGLAGSPVKDWPVLQGVHRREGIVACAGPRFRTSTRIDAPISILDVTPTILALFGLAPLEDADGRPSAALLSEPPATERLVASGESRRGEQQAYSAEEEEQVKERLRGLGYIE